MGPRYFRTDVGLRNFANHRLRVKGLELRAAANAACSRCRPTSSRELDVLAALRVPDEASQVIAGFGERDGAAHA
jgi:hypothetical protein